MKRLLVIFCVLFSFSSFAQEGLQKELEIRLIYLSKPLAGGIILNKEDKSFKISDDAGIAKIKVMLGDTLEVSHANTEINNVVVTEFVVSQPYLDIQMKQRVVALEEVEIKKLNQSTMVGVPNYGKETLSRADREFNAKSTPNILKSTSGMPGGAISIDFVYNWISGKTKEVRVRRSLELKEQSLAYLDANFSDYFLNSLDFESGRMNRLFEASLDQQSTHDLIKKNKVNELKIYLLQLSDQFPE